MRLLNSVKFKVIIPPFILFSIIIVFAVIFGGKFFNNSTNERVEGRLNSEALRMQHKIDRNMHDISSVSHLLSSMKVVASNINNYNLNNNSNNNHFSKELINLDSDFAYDMDFFSLNGEIIYTNHRNNIISNGTEELIEKVVNSNNPIAGFYNIFEQKRIASAYPVIFNGVIAGVVLVSQNMETLVSNFYLPKNIAIVLVDDKKELILESGNINRRLYKQIKSIEINDFSEIDNFKVKQVEINNRRGELFATSYLLYNLEEEQLFMSNLVFYLLLFSLFAFVFGGLIYSVGINLTIVKPVKKINSKILVLSKGEFSEKLEIKSNDELGQIMKSVNDLIDNQKSTALFANKIGKGMLDIEHKVLSDKDEMGGALVNMMNKLIDARDEDALRKIEDDKRNWAVEGFAKFGEILREASDDINDFSNKIISNLVKYTNSNQAGLYIYNDNDPENISLDLVAKYAYDRKKYADEKILLGDGLVGTCAIEKETIYITDIPEGYITVTSGLGDAVPSCILLVPLKIEDKIFGIIEIASFSKIEKYKINFIEKLAESITQSINSTKVNIITTQLLEQSQQQQEEMKAQEEELRQNMEEMLATQEESARKELEMKGVLDALNKSSLVAMFDLNWNVISVNNNFERLFGIPKENMIGMNHSDFSGLSIEEKTDLKAKLKNDEIISLTTRFDLQDETHIWLKELYAPIKDSEGEAIKIINISTDITYEKDIEDKLNKRK